MPASRSALTMARLRAAHQLLDEPTVLDDPFAFCVLGDALARQTIADPYPCNDPMLRTMRAAVVARSRFCEDRLQTAMGAGVRQVVVLGAGLDTLSLRVPADVRCVEVDRADVQRWKLDRLSDAGIAVPFNVAFAAADLAAVDLRELLARHGVRPGAPTFISCLGVLPYLDPDPAMALLDVAAGYPAGSEIVFDARVPRDSLPPVEQWMDDVAAKWFAASGEPWLSDFDPQQLQTALLGRGFCEVECLSAGQLNARYFARRRDGLQSVGGGLRLYRATVG
ncbi:SAM-dependent methyltransferase [Cupriavidus sp. AU9028]|uniref:class I SAM-dependent methyltransferase n=1 Tax=Cupriavidus sp. AU9028 TaxID=2871157 RepID=UPI001C95CCE0|nr:SAM-dependent methyltransferase [Cupriavidus sp. AU9028]MBY4897056.1 SAM-dependent methyltransferase [Cupriavidus sp. AU9028]